MSGYFEASSSVASGIPDIHQRNPNAGVLKENSGRSSNVGRLSSKLHLRSLDNLVKACAQHHHPTTLRYVGQPQWITEGKRERYRVCTQVYFTDGKNTQQNIDVNPLLINMVKAQHIPVPSSSIVYRKVQTPIQNLQNVTPSGLNAVDSRAHQKALHFAILVGNETSDKIFESLGAWGV